MLTRQQRDEMLREYLAGKSSGVLARKYGVANSYPRSLASKMGLHRTRTDKAMASIRAILKSVGDEPLQSCADDIIAALSKLDAQGRTLRPVRR